MSNQQKPTSPTLVTPAQRSTLRARRQSLQKLAAGVVVGLAVTSAASAAFAQDSKTSDSTVEAQPAEETANLEEVEAEIASLDAEIKGYEEQLAAAEQCETATKEGAEKKCPNATRIREEMEKRQVTVQKKRKMEQHAKAQRQKEMRMK